MTGRIVRTVLAVTVGLTATLFTPELGAEHVTCLVATTSGDGTWPRCRPSSSWPSRSSSADRSPGDGRRPGAGPPR
jgi:hypothetical protein